MKSNLVVYAIYDRLSGQYGAPALAVNEDCAIRESKMNLQNSKILEDLEVYAIGEYNVETAELIPQKPIVLYKFKGDTYEE